MSTRYIHGKKTPQGRMVFRPFGAGVVLLLVSFLIGCLFACLLQDFISDYYSGPVSDPPL